MILKMIVPGEFREEDPTKFSLSYMLLHDVYIVFSSNILYQHPPNDRLRIASAVIAVQIFFLRLRRISGRNPRKIGTPQTITPIAQ
jgi:hypothetical protein